MRKFRYLYRQPVELAADDDNGEGVQPAVPDLGNTTGYIMESFCVAYCSRPIAIGLEASTEPNVLHIYQEPTSVR